MRRRSVEVEGESPVWAVARAFGSEDEATARTVEEAEDQRRDELIRNQLTRKETRDAMKASFR